MVSTGIEEEGEEDEDEDEGGKGLSIWSLLSTRRFRRFIIIPLHSVCNRARHRLSLNSVVIFGFYYGPFCYDCAPTYV